jgi:hypothetical protein
MHKILLAAAAAVSLGSAAHAQNNQVVIDHIGNWTLYAQLNVGCYANVLYNSGTEMQIGEHLDGKIYITLYNRNWTSLQPGNSYPMAASFNNGQFGLTWTAIAKRNTGGSIGVYGTLTP